MPLPDPRPQITHAPVRAGVGLRAELNRERARRPPSGWPEDWWQRNYDLLLETNGPDPIPLTLRQQKIPGFPYPDEELA